MYILGGGGRGEVHITPYIIWLILNDQGFLCLIIIIIIIIIIIQLLQMYVLAYRFRKIHVGVLESRNDSHPKLCEYIESNPYRRHDTYCEVPTKGSWVKIWKNANPTDDGLTLCEVMVIGAKTGRPTLVFTYCTPVFIARTFDQSRVNVTNWMQHYWHTGQE